MALPETEAAVLEAYSLASRLKINLYLSERRVLALGADPDGQALSFQVAGNRPLPYMVSISTAASSSLDAARCDCPAGGLCVHIGASWITHLRELALPSTGAAAERDAALESLRLSLLRAQGSADAGALQNQPDKSGGAENAPPSPLVPNPLEQDDPEPEPVFTMPSGDASLSNEIDALFGAELVATADRDAKGERWALGFLLDSLPMAASLGAARPRRQVVMRPILCYRRQDGGLGRHKDWKASQLTEIPDDNGRYWLDAALAMDGWIGVEQALLMMELPGVPPLPALRTAKGELVRVLAIGRIKLVFRPRLEKYSQHDLIFEASMVADTPAGGEFEIASWTRGLRYILLLGQAGELGMKPVEARLASLLEFLEQHQHRLDPAAIERLALRLKQEPILALTMEWLGRHCKRRLARGLPVLTLEPGVEGVWGSGPRQTGITLDIDWDLEPDGEAEKERTSEAAVPSSDWLRHITIDTQDRATLWLRDLDWEAQVLAWLKQSLTKAGLSLPGGQDKLDWDGIPVRKSPFADRYRALPSPLGNRPANKLNLLDETRQFNVSLDLRQFLMEHAAWLMDAGFSLRLHRNDPPSRKGSVGIQVDRGLDWLDIEAQINSLPYGGAPGRRKRLARQGRLKALDAGRREELAAVQDLLKAGIARTATGLIRLDPADAERLRRLLDAGLEAGKPTRVASANIAQLAALHDASTSHIREIATAHEIVDKLGNLDTLELLDPAPGFRAELRGYQRRGFSWLLQMRQAGLGACLADDMGLGKTVQALAALQLMKQAAVSSGREFQALLVVPVSTLPNWEAEAGRFTPDLKVCRHEGADRAKDSIEAFQDSLQEVDLLLVSYATLRIDQEIFAAKMWTVMLIDEAHTIKNPESATFTAIRSIPADWRLSLTGTPVENSVLDLWAQMEFINPGILGSLKRFRSRYGMAIEERRDDAALETLRRIISPFILRRKKEDVARDLPPKEEIVLYCDLAEPQRQVYEDIKEAYRLKVDEAVKKDGINRSALTILEALLRLRQACLIPGVINAAWDQAGSAKLQALVELLEDLAAEGHKALVFSQFVEVLHRIRDSLDGRRIGYCYLDGQSQDRAESVSRFQSDPASQVFLISLKAGGVGINLTAADYVVLFDPWWNPAVEAQAIDRAHRIGQDKPVIVYRLIARDTVEEKIMQLQASKRDLAGALVSGDEGLVKSLDPDELRQLFG